MIRSAPFPLVLLLAATACSDHTPRGPAATPQDQLQQEVKEDQLTIRLDAAEKRIVQLERQVGELQTTPEKVDLDLLTKRVQQVEARVYARGNADAPPPARPPREPSPEPTPSPIPNRFNPFGL